MANLERLKKFINGLRDNQLFNTGAVGATSQRQEQMIELRRAFALLQAQPEDQKAKDSFRKSLLVAHAVSLITDEELQKCEDWLEEK